jgi:glycosyltransferase involved in cell wall biosynthesis
MGRRKKVFWLIKGLNRGGAEQLLTLSLPYLERAAFDYELGYLLPYKTDLVPEFERWGVPTFCLNARSPLDLGIGLRLARLLKERQVDLLHVHSPYPAILGRIVCKLRGPKAVVFTAHSMLGSFNPLTRLFIQLTAPLDQTTIAVSQAVRRSFVQGTILKPRNIEVIYGSIDADKFNGVGRPPEQVRASLGIPSGHMVVGNVAHLRSHKGYGYFLDAARRIREHCPDTTFIIVGREMKQGYQAMLETRADELGIKESVIFTGFLDDPLPVVNLFDVFMMSSIYEGLPVSLLEAMAMGKPPVATAVGGVPEVIQDAVNGFLVEPRSPEALARKVIELLRDDRLRAAMSQRARATVEERFTIKAMVREIERVYQAVLNSRN